MSQDVTVIVVAKNEQKYIRKTLESIASQDLSSKELFVVDGKSKDNTVAIAEEFGAEILYEDKNIATARNVGARKATGEVIVFVDADTELSKDCLTHIYNFFLNNPSVTGLCGRTFPKKTPIDYTFINRIIVSVFYNLTTKISFLLERPHVTGICMAFRRDSFLKIGGFKENLALGEDTDIYRRISRKGETIYFPKIVTFTSMRRFRKKPLYWLSYWFVNSLAYELCGRTLHKKYPKEG